MNKNLNTTQEFAKEVTGWVTKAIAETAPEMFEHILEQHKEQVLKQCRLELVQEVNKDFDMLLAFTGRTREDVVDTNNRAALELIDLREKVERLENLNKSLSETNKDLWDRIEALEMENQDLIKDKRRVLMKEDKPECCRAGYCGTEKCKGNCKKKVDKVEEEKPLRMQTVYSIEDLLNLLSEQ